MTIIQKHTSGGVGVHIPQPITTAHKLKKGTNVELESIDEDNINLRIVR
jgi:hypothetical protein